MPNDIKKSFHSKMQEIMRKEIEVIQEYNKYLLGMFEKSVVINVSLDQLERELNDIQCFANYLLLLKLPKRLDQIHGSDIWEFLISWIPSHHPCPCQEILCSFRQSFSNFYKRLSINGKISKRIWMEIASILQKDRKEVYREICEKTEKIRKESQKVLIFEFPLRKNHEFKTKLRSI